MPPNTSRIRQHVNECYGKVALLNSIASGSLTLEELIKCTRRHYAEVRTFIELKLPERLRICPRQAYSAKKYFWEIYHEEQGDFEPGKDHAELFKPICYKLGISDDDLEIEFSSYWPHYAWMRVTEPSYPAMIRELAVSYAWESLIVNIGPGLVAALKSHYGFADRDLSYFRMHADVDQKHSEAALNTLAEYLTDERREILALEAITDSLIHHNYFRL